MSNSTTSWKLYSSNSEAWSAMLEDCQKAQKSIVLEQYIFVSDEFGQKFIDICAERASAGVRVKFLWDAAGSFTFWGSNIVAELKNKGIELVFWKTIIPAYYKVPNFRSWFLRNHRRTLVIDNQVGYTGSICVQDRMKNWRDTNARFEGKIVREMSNAFERMWNRAIGNRPLPKRVKAHDHEFKYITNYPAPGRRHIHEELLEAIRNAQKYIHITNPYFVPTKRLARVIKLASHRGVEVEIIIPEKSNYYTVDLGARSYFKHFMESGVRIFLYTGNMIHSKTVVIDDEWSTVGTMNMDSISLLYNFEANIISTNAKFARELDEHFTGDLAESKEVNLKEFNSRFFVEKIPEILIKLVRKFL